MYPRHLSTLGTVLLVILLVMAGAPAAACAAMAECPMLAPVEECHGSASQDSHPSPRLQPVDDCCRMTAQPPSSAPPAVTLVVSAIADVPATAGQTLSVVAVRSTVRGGAPPPSRPAGRALLSLQQTLLI